jgi:hypothetical protein
MISSDVRANLEYLRTPLLRYLRDPNAKIDKSVQQGTFKHVLHNDELYRRTAEDLLLKCLDMIKQEWLWEKFMKVFVVCINRPQRCSGYCVEPVSISLL